MDGTVLETVTSVAVASASNAQLQLVSDSELDDAGHILVSPGLDDEDGSLAAGVVVDRSSRLVTRVPRGEHRSPHLGHRALDEGKKQKTMKNRYFLSTDPRTCVSSPRFRLVMLTVGATILQPGLLLKVSWWWK